MSIDNPPKSLNWPLVIPLAIVVLLALLLILKPLFWNAAPSGMPKELVAAIDKKIQDTYALGGGTPPNFPNHGIQSAQKATILTTEDTAAGVKEIWCLKFIMDYNGSAVPLPPGFYALKASGQWGEYSPSNGSFTNMWDIWGARGCTY